ncbi:MAG: hypothetical protein AAF349_16460 [Cyanobacteria bacterium P01_A01_bin.68]
MVCWFVRKLETLVTNIQPDWFDRYGRRVENYRLPKLDSERASNYFS